MKRTPHTVNGKLLGIWYETDAGTRMYLGHRTPRQIHRLRGGWCIDVGTLKKCQAAGVQAVGIICRRNGGKYVWLSAVEDFFDPTLSFLSRGPMGAERGIRLSHFRIDPGKSAEKIDKAFRIG